MISKALKAKLRSERLAARDAISSAQRIENSLAMAENNPLIEKILTLRHQIANALGYKTWADFQIEVKMAKNRIHWDLKVVRQGDIDQLIALGAGLLRPPDDEIGWTVMVDPEGNEFCVFVDR